MGDANILLLFSPFPEKSQIASIVELEVPPSPVLPCCWQ